VSGSRARRKTGRERACVCAVVAGAMLFPAACGAAGPSSPFSGYGRRGAEVWVEVPRYTVPIGEAYVNEYRIENGWGFGFGLMFGFTDVLALEVRVVQSNHEVIATGETWDLDHAFVGARYTFSPEEDLQPFVSVGGLRLALEQDVDLESSSDFRRATGYGGFVSVGFDRIITPRLVLTIRGDYYVMSFSREFVGTYENDFAGESRGDGTGISFSLGYRVPTW
jgi:hypothetical protein